MPLSAALNHVSFDTLHRCLSCGSTVSDSVDLALCERSLGAAEQLLGGRRVRCPACQTMTAFAHASYTFDELQLPPLRYTPQEGWSCAGQHVCDERALRRICGRPFSPHAYLAQGVDDTEPWHGVQVRPAGLHTGHRLRVGDQDLWVTDARLRRALSRQAQRFGLSVGDDRGRLSLTLDSLRMPVRLQALLTTAGLHALTCEEAAAAACASTARRLTALAAAFETLPPAGRPDVGPGLTFARAGRHWSLLGLLAGCGEDPDRTARTLRVCAGAGDWPCACEPQPQPQLSGTVPLTCTPGMACAHFWQPTGPPRPVGGCEPGPAGAVSVRSLNVGGLGVMMVWGHRASVLCMAPDRMRGLPGIGELDCSLGGQLLAMPLRRDMLMLSSPQTPGDWKQEASMALHRSLGPESQWMGGRLAGALPFSVAGPASAAVAVLRS